jgi:hypothetical protein
MLHVRAFVVGWLVTTALGSAIVMLRGYDWVQGMVAVVVVGAAFSVLMSILLVRRLSVLQGGASTRPTAARVTLAGAESDVLARCRGAVSSLPDAVLRRGSPQDSRIVARIGGLMTGQRIELRLDRQQTFTAVRVESRPRSPLLLFDYGQNERNVELITAALQPPDDT